MRFFSRQPHSTGYCLETRARCWTMPGRTSRHACGRLALPRPEENQFGGLSSGGVGRTESERAIAGDQRPTSCLCKGIDGVKVATVI